MNIKELTKKTEEIAIDEGYVGIWDLSDANCLLLLREHYRIHTFEMIGNKDKWVAAHKGIRGHGYIIFDAEIDCVRKIIEANENNKI